MSKQSIVVADSDPKNLQILKENLEAVDFHVRTTSDGWQAWEQIAQNPPAIVLSEVSLPGMDGLQLLERLQQNETTAALPLIFLTNKQELQDRIRSLKMGAKDYLVKPLHVKEVIAHIKMVLGRLERRESTDSDSFFKIMGKLEELNVFDLIENFGVEQKTGILTIHNSNDKYGRIFFKNGCVISAIQGDFRREKAVYQMLPWKKGYFTMVFKDVTVEDEIAVSNLGLLLEGLKRMEQREKYMAQFPSPYMKFLPTSIFRKILSKKKFTKELIKFISLFDGKRDILDIIDDSCYDDLKTLERIIRLYRQGFIKPVQPAESPEFSETLPEPASEEVSEKEAIIEDEGVHPDIRSISEPPQIKAPPFEPEEESVSETEDEEVEMPVDESEHLRTIDSVPIEPADKEEKIIPQILRPKSVASESETPEIDSRPIIQKGLSVFIGDDILGDSSIFNLITDGKYQVRSFRSHGIGDVKFGRAKIKNIFELEIISVSQSAQFTRLLDHFSDQLTNYLLIVDCTQPETWDYNGYLARALHEKYAAPFFIMAVNQEQSDISSIDILRDRLGINAKLPIVSCDSPDKDTISEIISKFIVGLPEKKQMIKEEKPLMAAEV